MYEVKVIAFKKTIRSIILCVTVTKLLVCHSDASPPIATNKIPKIVTATIRIHIQDICLRTYLPWLSPPRWCDEIVDRELGAKTGCHLVMWMRFVVISGISAARKRHYDMKFQSTLMSAVMDRQYHSGSLDFLGFLPNPASIDISVVEGTPIRFTMEVGIYDVSSASGTSMQDISYSKFEQNVTLDNVTQKIVLGRCSLNTSDMQVHFTLTYSRILCEERDDDCNGHFTCDKDHKKVCRKNYYGENCLRKCDEGWVKTFPGIKGCDKNGFLQCRENYYGSECNRYCKPERSIRTSFTCDVNGTMICDKGFIKNRAGTKCLNECARKITCVHGTCRDAYLGDMTCRCKKGYTGKKCERVTCYPGFCLNGGECQIIQDTTRCKCRFGYFGKRCGYYNKCRWNGNSNYCKNFGECMTHMTYVNCYCLPGYFGQRCEKISAFSMIPLPKPPSINDKSYQILIGILIFTILYSTVVIAYCTPKLIRRC